MTIRSREGLQTGGNDYPVTPAILLNDGTYFYFQSPTVADYNIRMIARSLSKLCRFTGHTRRFYSVAQHCVLVSKLVYFYRNRSAALLHDAGEFAVNDVSSPLKSLLPDYKKISIPIQEQVWRQYGLYPLQEDRDDIHRADIEALATEQRDLMPPKGVGHWHILDGVAPSDQKVIPLPAWLAELQFLSRWDELENWNDPYVPWYLRWLGKLLVRYC